METATRRKYGKRALWASAVGAGGAVGLFDTAKDIDGLRDLERFLAAIVHRARILLGQYTKYRSCTTRTQGHVHAGDRRLDIGPFPVASEYPWAKALDAWWRLNGGPYATSDYAPIAIPAHGETIGQSRKEGMVRSRRGADADSAAGASGAVRGERDRKPVTAGGGVTARFGWQRTAACDRHRGG